jgi:hypothetical protein
VCAALQVARRLGLVPTSYPWFGDIEISVMLARGHVWALWVAPRLVAWTCGSARVSGFWLAFAVWSCLVFSCMCFCPFVLLYQRAVGHWVGDGTMALTLETAGVCLAIGHWEHLLVGV